MIQHVIYLSARHIFVFQWQKKTLITSTLFSGDDQGIANFEKYLQAHSEIPFKITVDIYEEDYRREKIPNVRGKDRASIIERLIDRHYRDEKYTYTHKLSNSKNKRKDSRILLCALGENDLLEKTLLAMKKNQTIISGIWSLAIISNELVKYLSATTKGCTLLISQQTTNHQREMFFKNSDLYFSRKTVTEKDIEKSFFENIDKTKKFISNQKIIGFNDKLSIISIYDETNKKAISESKNTDIAKDHTSYSTNEVIKKMGLKNCKHAFGATIFSYLCSKSPARSNHYLKNENRKNYRHYSYNKTIKNLCSVVFLSLTAASLMLFIQHSITEKDIAELNNQNLQLQREFTENYSTYNDYLEHSEAIKKSVETSKKIAQMSNITPFNYFSPISKTLSNEQFSSIRIDEFHWEKLSKEKREMAEIQLQGGVTNQLYMEELDDEGSYEAPAKLKTIVLSGAIASPFANYRDNAALINQWKNSLQSLNQVNRISILETPSDIRPTKKFRDSITNKEGHNDQESSQEKNKYRYKIFLDVKDGEGDKNG